jgi:hypothetical protein
MILSTFSLRFKKIHAPPFFVVDCNGQKYYVLHRLQSMSRMAIHLGVHNHFIMDGKCWESVEETRRLNINELDHTPNVKVFVISFSVSKTFLASYLLKDFSDGIVELFKGGQLKHIQDKLCELSSPNIYNLVVFFKHHSGGGYIDNILELKSNNCYDYIQECCFSRQVLG